MTGSFGRAAAFVERFGEAVASVILTLVYFVVLGPLALLARLVVDPLGLRRGPEESAWQDWPAERRDPTAGTGSAPARAAVLARARRQG